MHTLLMFRALARHRCWLQSDSWMDSSSGFAVHLFEQVHGRPA